MRTAIKSAAGLVILAILTGSINGCTLFYPVSKKDVIGIYQMVHQDGTPGLPDGGSEILELREDGACIQKVSLKDGRTFSAQGTWEWDADNERYVGKKITLMGTYDIVDNTVDTDKLRTDIEKTRGILKSYSVSRTLIGRVLLGSREVSHYEKK